jgi:acetyl esterase/lipase
MAPTEPDEQNIQADSSAGTIRLAYGPELLNFGELYLPASAGPHPVVILIHGGYWRARYGLDLMTGLARDLAQRAIATWNIEYRRVGDDGGGWPGTFVDVALAADYLQEIAPTYNLDLQRVIPVGHSAGGHLAFWLAARPRLAPDSPLATTTRPLPLLGAISLAGVVDLELAWKLRLSNGAVIELLGGDFDELSERYRDASPAALLPLGIPQVVIHGTADDNVPLQMSLDYVAKASAVNDPITFIELEGVDHFALIDPNSGAWAITIEQLEKLLAGHG